MTNIPDGTVLAFEDQAMRPVIFIGRIKGKPVPIELINKMDKARAAYYAVIQEVRDVIGKDDG